MQFSLKAIFVICVCELVKVWRQTTSQILNGAQIHSQKWCWFTSTANGGAIYRWREQDLRKTFCAQASCSQYTFPFKNKMLEPAIIEASMNLNIEHHTILSESEKTYSRHRPLILYSTLPVLFDFGAKGRMKGPTLRRTQKELPT